MKVGKYERTLEIRKKIGSHGERLYRRRSPEWQCWAGMISRCRNTNRPDSYRYSLIGIKVCRRWRKFENFLADMGRKPSPLHTLERKNGKLGYRPSNCVWATRREQRLNQPTRVHMFTLDGVTLCLKDWGRLIGASQGCMMKRWRYGWPKRRMLTEPPVVGRNQFSRKS